MVRRSLLGRRALGACALVVLVAACNDDGRALRDPGVTQPSVTQAVEELPAIRLSSQAFVSGAAFPIEYTCDGQDTSPPLEFDSVPTDVVELAVLVDDLDAGGFVHWLVAGVDPTISAFEAGVVPPGAVVVANDFGARAWAGPCPPDDELHTYLFTLYGLTEPSGITADTPTLDARTVLGEAPYSDVLSVFYERFPTG